MSQGFKSASLKSQVIKQAANTNYCRTTKRAHATQKSLISYTQTQKEHPKKKKRMQQKARKVYFLRSPQLFLSGHDFCNSLLDQSSSHLFQGSFPVTFPVFKMAMGHHRLAPHEYPSLPSTSKHIATVPGVRKHLP